MPPNNLSIEALKRLLPLEDPVKVIRTYLQANGMRQVDDLFSAGKIESKDGDRLIDRVTFAARLHDLKASEDIMN